MFFNLIKLFRKQYDRTEKALGNPLKLLKCFRVKGKVRKKYIVTCKPETHKLFLAELVRKFVYVMHATTKTQISMVICAVSSEPLLFAANKLKFSNYHFLTASNFSIWWQTKDTFL